MFDTPGLHRIRNFDVNDDGEREACEKILTKYSNMLGRLLRTETMFTKDGRYFMAVHWIEDIPESEYRD